jgi:hypothetical protein
MQMRQEWIMPKLSLLVVLAVVLMGAIASALRLTFFEHTRTSLIVTDSQCACVSVWYLLVQIAPLHSRQPFFWSLRCWIFLYLYSSIWTCVHSICDGVYDISVRFSSTNSHDGPCLQNSENVWFR